MTHRTDRVYLPANVTRCDPGAATCRHRLTCARYMAALPATGAKLENFVSSGAMTAGGFCVMRMPLSDARRPPIEPPAPRVHPPLGSAL